MIIGFKFWIVMQIKIIHLTVFSQVNPPGPVNCIPEDSLPHEYFLHMNREDFVDLLVKETNTYGDDKIQAKGTIPKSSHFHKWCHKPRRVACIFSCSCKYGID